MYFHPISPTFHQLIENVLFHRTILCHSMVFFWKTGKARGSPSIPLHLYIHPLKPVTGSRSSHVRIVKKSNSAFFSFCVWSCICQFALHKQETNVHHPAALINPSSNQCTCVPGSQVSPSSRKTLFRQFPPLQLTLLTSNFYLAISINSLSICFYVFICICIRVYKLILYIYLFVCIQTSFDAIWQQSVMSPPTPRIFRFYCHLASLHSTSNYWLILCNI